MANDSSTGGFLAPALASPPLEDAELDAVLQALVAGVTGLPGTMVRPRWQPVIPKQPEPSVDWCAIGVTSTEPDANASVLHDAAGADLLTRHENINVLATFYGPACARNGSALRDGLQIAQNREALPPVGLAFVSVGNLVRMPELVNQQWVRRVDVPLQMRRVVNRTYPVLNIQTAGLTVKTDDGRPSAALNVLP